MSGRAISAQMGKAPTFISSTLNQGSPPSADTLAAVARVVGARVCIELEDGSSVDITDSGQRSERVSDGDS
ncbi:hypothetical protein [uncultured Olegusella sp.]|uniref:hypothetical protein n=1 Tax=uncultured Olegusella sp. TaxID=1979846 RepID=UPI0026249879|nr:hypothetical protein [uncultured Olegusella sp.]